MTGPRPPRIRAKTDTEKAAEAADRERHALDAQLRQLVDRRAARAETASPYDLVADALMRCVEDQVFAAIHSPDFAAQLAERGYRVVPAVPAGRIPDPPGEWLHDALDLLGLTGEPTDLYGHVHGLWERAWAAGREAAP